MISIHLSAIRTKPQGRVKMERKRKMGRKEKKGTTVPNHNERSSVNVRADAENWTLEPFINLPSINTFVSFPPPSPPHLSTDITPVVVDRNTPGTPRHDAAGKPRGKETHSGLLPAPPSVAEVARGQKTSITSLEKEGGRNDYEIKYREWQAAVIKQHGRTRCMTINHS